MPFTQFTRPVQTKLHQFCYSFAGYFSRPVQKFVRQMVFGILKSGTVQLNGIGRSLQEEIALKKTTKRLGDHLDKPGLWKEVSNATLHAQTSVLRQCRFVIVDLSDLCKEYAEQMEGLATVYDSSEKELGQGYWLCDISAVNDTASTIVPIYSELFSHTAEITSENKKILAGVEAVEPYCDPEAIWVNDRGGDREQLLQAHLQGKRQFITRQQGKRHLWYQGKPHGFDFLTRKTRLRWAFTIERIHDNKTRKRTYDCGALRVQLTPHGKPLWLVVMKGREGGYCWLLCYFKDCRSAKQAVDLALKGYGLRWKIEEVHRQIKVDYHVEAMRLERYEALKTMNALLWMAVSFLYTRLESLALEIIFHPELALVNRKKLKDVLQIRFGCERHTYRALFLSLKGRKFCRDHKNDTGTVSELSAIRCLLGHFSFRRVAIFLQLQAVSGIKSLLPVKKLIIFRRELPGLRKTGRFFMFRRHLPGGQSCFSQFFAPRKERQAKSIPVLWHSSRR